MYSLLKKALFQLDPETAHELVKSLSPVAPKSLLKLTTCVKDPCLQTKIGNTNLSNPIGLAAGFDKNGEMIELLQALGFGFLELGSVTAYECEGNPKPRIFRLPKDESLINRMGLPNFGADKFATHLAKQKINTPIGINIAKTPDFAKAKKVGKALIGIDDFATSFRKLHHLGDYVVFNLSCPNTNDGKTFEDPTLFAEFATAMIEIRKEVKFTKPLLVKLSPDLDAKSTAKIVDSAIRLNFDGFVISNTTSSRNGLKTDLEKITEIGRGGLSGKALLPKANQQLKNVFEIVGRNKILIGVGGIMSFEDLLSKLACGAQLFQIYTGFIYQGPLFIAELNKALVRFCKKEGVKNYQELIGKKSTD